MHQETPEEPVSEYAVKTFMKESFDRVKHTIQLSCQNGEAWDWEGCRPDLLFQVLATESDHFRIAMKEAIDAAGTAPLHGVLYLDEVVPGNVLRPDNRRKFWAIYFGVLEWGGARLCRCQWWLPIACIRSSVASGIDGGISHCVARLAHDMLLDPCRLATVGTTVKLPAPTLVRVELRTLLGDESALKSTWFTKGASGVRPCMFCANLVSGHSGLASGSTQLVDVSCSNPNDFQPTTDQTVWESWDRLASEQGRRTRADWAMLERASGPY